MPSPEALRLLIACVIAFGDNGRLRIPQWALAHVDTDGRRLVAIEETETLPGLEDGGVSLQLLPRVP